jgi:formylglycine-generating enzyme required for sulfatase activity
VTISAANPLNIEFVTIPAGQFDMGSNTGYSDEKPVHRVVISKSFQLGKYEITQGQWKAVMGSNPSYFTGDDNLPVEQVSWNDVQLFIDKMNARNDGYRYRLPTEAEWEYACRAGTTGDYAGNLDQMGWYSSNSGGRTHAVGTKTPNPWGLYDMHGNVWEWVQDWYGYGAYPSGTVTDPTGPSSGSYRVARGGSWGGSAPYCRSARRSSSGPGLRSGSLGFRLLRTAQ